MKTSHVKWWPNNDDENESSYLLKDQISSFYNQSLVQSQFAIPQRQLQGEIFELLEPQGPPYDVKNIISSLQTNGVVIIKDLYREKVSEYPVWIKNIRSAIETYKFQKPEVIHEDKRHLILHNKGRIDLWPVEGLIDLEISSTILTIIGRVIKCHWKCQSQGVLSLDKQTTDYGKWHRDTSQLFNFSENLQTSDFMNASLPDYYFTVFIPLTDISINTGPTEVILGSHQMTVNDAQSANKSYLSANCGDVIIMNGKLLHRSTPNLSDLNRDLLYMVFTASWFNEHHVGASPPQPPL